MSQPFILWNFIMHNCRSLHMVRYISTLTLLALVFPALSQVNHSVLSEGEWYKIGVTHKGIYKIDRSFLSEIGLNPENLDPRELALYGNGGNGMLPQANQSPRPEDLTENSIFVEGEKDGSFDSDDYLLFFGNSPDHLSYNAENKEFRYEKNLYSDTLYYFLTIKESGGLRVNSKESFGSDHSKITSFPQVFVHELDETNLIKGGRVWFGELFSSNKPEYTFSFPAQNLLNSGLAKVQASVMAQAFQNTTFTFSLNGQSLGSITTNKVPNRQYAVKGDIQKATFETNLQSLSSTSNGLSLQIKYQSATNGPSTGFLDYVVLQAESALTLTDNLLFFHLHPSESPVTIEIESGELPPTVWNVSDAVRPVQQLTDRVNTKILFGLENATGEFVAFRGNNFPNPHFAGKISNQNLHGLGSADALIITHGRFLTQAHALKQHRESVDNFTVHVATVDQIYNEFSSGAQDVSAIRDFIRHIYLKDPTRLKYALLFGDCSYDYKYRAPTFTNYVPVYEARNSLHPLYNFSSDDYFGFMDEDEGEWAENEAGDHTLELGIGRIPVKSPQEAEDVVNKIIRYETSKNTFGKWRNEILFIADDGDNNIHQRDANYLANYVESTRNEFNVQKLFIDAYEQVSTPSGQSSPAARLAFEKAISEGKLMINYTGHGNEEQLTVEKIIDEDQIASLKNRTKLPFFITATCEFGNYDNPDRVSGGEKTLLNPNGGAIALLTSTRPVFSNTNFILNEAYYFAAMRKENGEFPRLGDIIRNTKNNSLEGAKNRNFALMGDPAMRLAFPKYQLTLTSVNGKTPDKADTLKALSQIQLKGEVRRADNSLVENFDGLLSVSVFDKPTQFSTLGDENTVPQRFDQRNALLFKGEATVNKGIFTINFVVPKNISYIFGEGKVSMYAVSKGPDIMDAHGASTELIVGGSNPNAITDQKPPSAALFINDTLFVNGGTSGPNPLFIAKIHDENGINISNQGFSQDITLSINGGEPFVINEYYTSETDSYQTGWIRYPLEALEPGNYTAKLKVYDTHNNFTEEEIRFTISEDVVLKLHNVAAAPNPYKSSSVDGVRFSFTHDREGEELLVSLQIINLQGRVISESRFRFDDSSIGTSEIEWNGKDAYGNRPQHGIYIYKLMINSTLDGAKNQAHGKLVIF